MNLDSICLPLSDLLDIIPSRFIHFVANGKISFLPWLRLLEALQNHRWVWTSWEAGLLSNDFFCTQPECMWNSVCVLKSGVCLLQPLPLPNAKSRGIQGQMSGASFWGRIPELVQTLCSFGGNSATAIILLYVGQLPSGLSPDYTPSLTLLSISVVPSLFHYGF